MHNVSTLLQSGGSWNWTAISNLVLVTASLINLVIIFFQTRNVGKQSRIMRENMERDRLLKKYERLNKELIELIGPLHANRELLNETIVYDIAYKNMYLNQSTDLTNSYNNYLSSKDIYGFLNGRTPESEDSSEINGRYEIHAKAREKFIESIDRRYLEISKRLADLESELNIQDRS